MSSQSVTSTSSTLFLVAIFVCFSLSSSRNPNFMQKGSSLSVEDNSDLLISADNTFTCGFYSVGENAYCFSIWFTNSKEKTVVWMANRDKPVNGKGSRVSLLRDGAFVLTDVDGSTTWETNTGTTDVQKAELLDNGNLVLMDSSGKILWQSFDFPTDTLLPHQPITRSKKMISRLGRGNYSAGYFNFYFDNDNVLRLMYDGPDTSTLYWPDVDNTVTQNGRTGYNNTRIAVLDDMGRIVDDHLGSSSTTMSSAWDLWKEWDLYLYTKLPRCSCLPGYEMTDPSNWNAGCKPRFSITCSQSQQLKFVEFQHMNFYGNDINIYSNKTLDWCKKKCKEDCQCQAFNYRLTGEVKCHLKAALFNGCKSSTVKVSTYLKLPLNIEISEYIILNDTNLTCSSRGYKVPVTGFSSTYMARGKKLRWVYLYCFASAVGVIEFIFLASGWWFLFRRHDVLVAVEEGYRIRLSNWVVEDGEDQEAELTRFVRVVKRKIQSEEATWIEDVVDTRLNGQFSRTQIAKMVEIGISCVEEDRNKRPTMDSIVQALMACEDVSRIRTPDNLSVII
ncbi:hypothetical protein POUND7_002070 [Theobroma cacao]